MHWLTHTLATNYLADVIAVAIVAVVVFWLPAAFR